MTDTRKTFSVSGTRSIVAGHGENDTFSVIKCQNPKIMILVKYEGSAALSEATALYIAGVLEEAQACDDDEFKTQMRQMNGD